jgi:hypothetical protein
LREARLQDGHHIPGSTPSQQAVLRRLFSREDAQCILVPNRPGKLR